LEDYLRQKLIEVGWKDDLKNYCKGTSLSYYQEQIREKGLEKVTIDELTDMLQVRGQATVPNRVKEDLLARLKVFFEENPI
jgi:enhancer of yellow 2 transcription factor